MSAKKTTQEPPAQARGSAREVGPLTSPEVEGDATLVGSIRQRERAARQACSEEMRTLQAAGEQPNEREAREAAYTAIIDKLGIRDELEKLRDLRSAQRRRLQSLDEELPPELDRGGAL